MDLITHFNELVETVSSASGLLQGVLAAVLGVLGSIGDAAGAFSFMLAPDDGCAKCPGSSFTSVGAAWGTIGYSVQADLLWQLQKTSFHHWAILLYLMAAGGGIIGAAMGMPPKTYLWFFIGPGLFWWMIGATEDTEGVAWKVAGKQQRQSVVWRDSEVGLQNSNLFSRENLKAYREKRPDVTDKMRVANLFLYVDTLFSATSQALIGWTGIWKATGRGGNDSNLAINEKEDGPWYIMSNNKWALMENITGSYARNPDVRDALVQFMASECGDRFKQVIDQSSYMAAGQLKRGIFPKTVFKLGQDPNMNGANDAFQRNQYRDKLKQMDVTFTKTPPSLIRLLEDVDSPTSFGKFSDSLGQRNYKKQNRGSMIMCSEYLWVIVQALRWEAGHAYWQLMRSAPLGLNHKQIMHSMYNGWNVRKTADGPMASVEEMHHLTRGLLFVHLLRNELIFAPQIADNKYAPSQQTRQYGEQYAGKVGAKSKYGELIQWALLMPHLQGILYFLLAAAYPMAALLVLVPNWYKSMFTWMSFMAWIKLWDVGFAMVMMIERSVWAMMGNNTHIEFVSRRILQMAEYESIGAECPNGGGIEKLDGTVKGLKELCTVPKVCTAGSPDLGCGGTLPGADTSGDDSYGILDQALMLGAGSELDLTNAYYLYIMAALYFAVPAVAGQLVLGAKAGAAGMVSNMIGGVSGEVGKAAVTGHQGVLSHIAATNSAAVGQAAVAKHYRTTGFAQNAMDMANSAMSVGQESDMINQTKQGWNTGNQALEFRGKDVGLGIARANTWVAQSKAVGDALAPRKGATAGDRAGGLELGRRLMDGAGGLGKAGNIAAGLGDAALIQRARRWETYLGQDAANRGMTALGKSSNADWDMYTMKQSGQGLGEGGRRANELAGGHAQMAAWDARNEFALGMVGNASVVGNVQSGALHPGAKPQDFHYLSQSGALGGSMQRGSMYPNTKFIFDGARGGAWGKTNLGSNYNWGLWDSGVHRRDGANLTESDLFKDFTPGGSRFWSSNSDWSSNQGAGRTGPLTQNPNLPSFPK